LNLTNKNSVSKLFGATFPVPSLGPKVLHGTTCLNVDLVSIFKYDWQFNKNCNKK